MATTETTPTIPEINDPFFQEFSNFDLESTNTSLDLADPEAYYALQKGITNLQQKREKLQLERDNFVKDPKIARIYKYVQMYSKKLNTTVNAQISPYIYNGYNDACKKFEAQMGKITPKISSNSYNISKLQKELQNIKDNIAYKSRLRGKQPNYNVSIVTEIEEHISLWNDDINKIKQSVQKDSILIDYPTLEDLKTDMVIYFNKINNFNKIDGKYYKQLKELNIELTKEIWRSRYITYAEKHSLNVDEENIFRVCNTYWIEQNMQTETIDCRFDCYYDYSDDDCDHVIEPGDSRCTRGTKIIITPNSDTVENNIGLINKQDFHDDYVTIEMH